MKKLASILLAAALLLAAIPGALAAEAAPEPDYAELVTDAFCCRYSDERGAYSFRVPQINWGGSGIQTVNDAIWNDIYERELYSEYGSMIAIAEGWSPEPWQIDYEWSVNGDMLSLWTVCLCGNDVNIYGVYNISLSAGRQITDEELLDVLEIKPEEFYDLAAQALSDAFEEKHAFLPEDEFKSEQRQSNNAEDNIRAVRPYLDENGDLCVIGSVYALAGAGKYDQPLTILDRDELPDEISGADLPE